MASTYIAGVGMVRFGKYDVDVDVRKAGRRSRDGCSQRCGRRSQGHRGVYVGHVFGGPVAGQRVAAELGLAGLPVSNHENYCASGATALREAWMAIRAGGV